MIVENFKVGDLARYGLAYDDLKHINPRLIYCSITGLAKPAPSPICRVMTFCFREWAD